MSKIEIEIFATFQTASTIFGTNVSPITMLAKFTNKTNNVITISELVISVKNHFLFFSKKINCNLSSFNVSKTKEIELDLSYVASHYSDNKEFILIAKDANEKLYKSDKVSLSLFKRK
jgi:hypothetical protein